MSLFSQNAASSKGVLPICASSWSTAGFLLAEGVGLDLVDGRDDLGEQGDVNEALGVEVGHADGAQLAGGQGVLQRAVGLDVARLVAVIGLVDLDPRLWGVDDHHVQVVEPRHS